MNEPADRNVSDDPGKCNQVSGTTVLARANSWWLLLAMSLLYLVVAMHTPVGVQGGAIYDSGLFMNHALSVLTGHWFGPYDQLALAKGQGYTFFLLLGYASGLPISLMHALLFILATLCVTVAIAELTSVTWFTVLVYAVLLWHPAAQPLRVSRDSIYWPQVVLIFGTSLLLMMAASRGRFRPLLAASTGILIGWFWMTREEGIWLIPGLTLLVCGSWGLTQRRQASNRALLSTLVVCLVATISVIVGYAATNKFVYGTFIGLDFKEANFVRAISSLQSVEEGSAIPYVPVPQNVRFRIYGVSPSFAELKQALDGDTSPAVGWRGPGCQVYPSTCGDFAGGWFVWALRDAVASKGYYRSPDSASAYYQKLADEIQLACDSGQLTCRPSLVPLMPHVTAHQWHAIPAKLLEAFEWLIFVENPPKLDVPPSNSNESIEALLGRPLLAKSQATSGYWLAGWYYARGAAWFHIRCRGGGDAGVTIRRKASPDVADALGDPGADHQRFDMIVNYDPACALELDGAATHGWNFQEVLDGKKAFALGNETLFIDSHQVIGDEQPVDKVSQWILWLRTWVSKAYVMVLPALGGLGLIAYLGHFALVVVRQAPVTLLFLTVSSFWLMIISRVMILVLIDISSFPGIIQRYLMPAYPLLCLAALLGLYGFYSEFWPRRAKSPE